MNVKNGRIIEENARKLINYCKIQTNKMFNEKSFNFDYFYFFARL